MLYFYNEEIKSLYSTVDIEDIEVSKEYVADMGKQGYVVISEKDYDKFSEQLDAVLQEQTDALNAGYVKDQKKAILDAKKAGWSDAMIEQAFGKAE